MALCGTDTTKFNTAHLWLFAENKKPASVVAPTLNEPWLMLFQFSWSCMPENEQKSGPLQT
jgi:hypothetical protein